MKPVKKWNNTVIEVLNKEHGKKVIEWWKEQGVDTGSMQGIATRADRNDYTYYGLINGNFLNYTKETVDTRNAKIITLPEPFPEKWYMVCTEENQELANEWRKSVAKQYEDYTVPIGFSFLSKHFTDKSFYYTKNLSKEYDKKYIDYSPITFEQFKEHVLKQQKQSNKMKITPEQAQQIIDMVSPSCKWKERLLDLWAKNIVLKQEINVDDSLYKEGYKDASESQKKVLDGIFCRSKEVKVPDINLSGFLCDRGAGEYDGIAFYLSEDYNWEIKKDSYGYLCLIPTNK